MKFYRRAVCVSAWQVCISRGYVCLGCRCTWNITLCCVSATLPSDTPTNAHVVWHMTASSETDRSLTWCDLVPYFPLWICDVHDVGEGPWPVHWSMPGITVVACMLVGTAMRFTWCVADLVTVFLCSQATVWNVRHTCPSWPGKFWDLPPHFSRVWCCIMICFSSLDMWLDMVDYWVRPGLLDWLCIHFHNTLGSIISWNPGW